MRVKVLYFNSSDIVELKNAELKDGFLTFEDKSFYVGEKDKNSLKIKSGFGVLPLYIIHHKSIYPAKLETKKEKGKVVETIIIEKDKKLTPDALYRSLNLRILGGMLKVSKGIGLLNIIFGVIIGAIAVVTTLYMMGLIR